MSNVTAYLADMERDATCTDLWTQEQASAWAKRYWAVRWDKNLSDEEKKARLQAHSEEFRPVRKVWTNDRGNVVIGRHWSTERYTFDFDDDFRAEGWLQFDTDQDAWYYGVWVNPKTLKTLSYAEGDVSLVVCPDAAHYNAEIQAMCEFHGEGFELIACDADAFAHIMVGSEPRGEARVYRQDRSQFFVKE